MWGVTLEINVTANFMLTDEAEPIGSMLTAFMEELDNGTAPAPVWSGLRSLDDLVGGFIPGQLIVICGRPGMGKSALTQTIALNAAMFIMTGGPGRRGCLSPVLRPTRGARVPARHPVAATPGRADRANPVP